MIRTPLRAFAAAALAAAAVSIAAARARELPGVLISRQLAGARGINAGDVVRLSRQPSAEGSREFRVVGVYEPTPDPMRFAQAHLEARLHLPDLLGLIGDPADPAAIDTIGAINVALVDPSRAETFARDLSAQFPAVLATPTTAPNDRTSTFVVIERFHLAIAIVTMIGSAVFLLALMVMLVDERRENIGTLRLIGLTRRRILLQVLAEGTLIAAAGTVFGLLFAVATERWFNRFFQWRYDTALVFLRITPTVAVQSVLLALPLGVVASLAASWTLVRRQVLTLIRR
jgi:ABC-type lipoprotein release transport system permease subunit